VPSIILFYSLLCQDVALGPYIIPDILPPNADYPATIYGDTLFQDNQEKTYVIHLSSGGKVYNPSIYDTGRAFEIYWQPKGLTIRNSRIVNAKVVMSPPHIPSALSGELNYTTVELPNETWGLYFYNKSHTNSERGWEHLGIWPPPQNIRTYWTKYYGVQNFNEDLVFNSSLNSRHVSKAQINSSLPIEDVLIFQIPSGEQASIKMQYDRLTVPPANYISWHSVDFDWGGKLDLTIDGLANELDDQNTYLSFWEQGDIRADWDLDGDVDSNDLRDFRIEAGLSIPDLPGNETTPPSKPRPPSFSSKSGCSVSAESQDAHIASPLISLLFLILGSLIHRKNLRVG